MTTLKTAYDQKCAEVERLREDLAEKDTLARSYAAELELVREELAAIKANQENVEATHRLTLREVQAELMRVQSENDKLREEIAAIKAQKPADVEVICESCDGSGNDRADNNYGCEVCQGSGRVTKQFYTAPQPSQEPVWLDGLVEAARLLGRTEAKKGFGCYTRQDSRFVQAMYEAITKYRQQAAIKAQPAQEPVHEWYCPTCRRVCDPVEVTYTEHHEHCGTPVVSIPQQAQEPMRCPDCFGSEIQGYKRGVRCATCNGTGEVEQQAQEPVLRIRKGKIDSTDCEGIEIIPQHNEVNWNWMQLPNGEHDLYASPQPAPDVEAALKLARDALNVFADLHFSEAINALSAIDAAMKGQP